MANFPMSRRQPSTLSASCGCCSERSAVPTEPPWAQALEPLSIAKLNVYDEAIAATDINCLFNEDGAADDLL
jgi:hypothetical protein